MNNVRTRHRTTVRYLAIALAAIACVQDAMASDVPFWGSRSSMPADTPVDQLKDGEFIWLAAAAQSGPMAMVVSLSEQRAYVYRNGVLIGATTVSSGRPGHATPTGVFSILQKDRDHHSSIYNAAPMPYMERLTWGGVALHAGGLPGYPESHGCVHLPSEFARLLFGISSTGMTVVIANEATQPRDVVHPGYLAPVSAGAGAPVRSTPLQESESLRWQPALAPTGPMSIVLSRGSGRAIVYRNGIEIGRARVIFRGTEPIGTHALILVEGPAQVSDRFLPDPQHERWLRIGIAGHAGDAGIEPDPDVEARIQIPPEFLQAVYPELKVGTTVLVTDAPLSPQTSGPQLDVINADPPAP